jgi:hypothetical protein
MTDSRTILHQRLDALSRATELLFSELCRLVDLDPQSHFTNRTLKDVDFKGSDLSQFDFSRTQFIRCSFLGVTGVSAIFLEATFDDCIEPPSQNINENKTSKSDEPFNADRESQWIRLIEAIQARRPLHASIVGENSVMGFSGLLRWTEKTQVFQEKRGQRPSTSLLVKGSFGLSSESGEFKEIEPNNMPLIGSIVNLIWPIQSNSLSSKYLDYPEWAPKRDKINTSRVLLTVQRVNATWTFLSDNKIHVDRRFKVVREGLTLGNRLVRGQRVQSNLPAGKNNFKIVHSTDVETTIEKVFNCWHEVIKNAKKRKYLNGTISKFLPSGKVLLCFQGAIGMINSEEFNSNIKNRISGNRSKNRELTFTISHFDNLRQVLVVFYRDSDKFLSADVEIFTAPIEEVLEIKMLSAVQVDWLVSECTEAQYLQP